MKKAKQYHTVGTVLKIKYQNRRKRQNWYPKHTWPLNSLPCYMHLNIKWWV